MEFLIGTSFLINLLFAVFCLFLLKGERLEKKDLMNRLMAKDYNEYSTFELRKEKKKEIKITDEDLNAEKDVYLVN